MLAAPRGYKSSEKTVHSPISSCILMVEMPAGFQWELSSLVKRATAATGKLFWLNHGLLIDLYQRPPPVDLPFIPALFICVYIRSKVAEQSRKCSVIHTKFDLPHFTSACMQYLRMTPCCWVNHPTHHSPCRFFVTQSAQDPLRHAAGVCSHKAHASSTLQMRNPRWCHREVLLQRKLRYFILRTIILHPLTAPIRILSS